MTISPWRVVYTLCLREWLRFFRQRNRVVGALGQPLVFWALFATGLGPTFRLSATGGEAISFGTYFFPGTLILVLLFTAIFTTISIIEDRREGFLQSVLVAPIPRWSMVLGKLLGGAMIAQAQGILFFVLGALLGLVAPGPLWLPLALFVYTLILSLGLTGLGFVIAWRMDSTQGFHAIMSLVLMPMWLLSGAFFPASAGWMSWVLAANPLTYGVAGLRRLLYWGDQASQSLPPDLPSLALCCGVTCALAAVMFVASCRVASVRTRGDLL